MELNQLIHYNSYFEMKTFGECISGCFQDKEGGFVVRESSQKGVYTVSVYTKTSRCFTSQLRQTHHKFTHDKYSHIYLSFFWFVSSASGDIRHYQIKISDTGQFFLAEKHTFNSIPDVIHYHEHNAAGT